MAKERRLILRVNGKQLVLLSDAAKQVGVSRLPLYFAIKKGLLKTVERFGRYTFVDLDEVRQWRQRHYNERRGEAQRQRWMKVKVKTKLREKGRKGKS
ncbi:MAG: hypothetical protein QXY85_08510 [Candidatus Nitrosocaldus sp.]